MKNDAAADVPAETPAGVTRLCEVSEFPDPGGSQLFCPEMTCRLEPSLPHSAVVAS